VLFERFPPGPVVPVAGDGLRESGRELLARHIAEFVVDPAPVHGVAPVVALTVTLRPMSDASMPRMLSNYESRRTIENSISLFRMRQFSAVEVEGPT
jgi:hypothetical protein